VSRPLTIGREAAEPGGVVREPGAPVVVIRTVTVLAILASFWYLSWRLTHLTGGAVWLGVPLFVCELYAAVRLWNLAFVAWTIRPTRRPPLTAMPTVDVFIPTYDESEEVLRATLTGCAAIDYPHYRVWVLDDGRRDWVRSLAERYGARYLDRPDHSHAKAGNINAAIPRTHGDLILSLDADHVAQPDILRALVGYFDDPKMAIVQTPHEFYNRDSIQHAEHDHHEQSFFFHLVQPGRDVHGAAFWCGSGALIRRTALVEAGGLSTATITEDFHTSLVIHGNGWTSRFHDEALVYGIAPHNLEQFILQRYRWSAGNLAALWTPQSPLRRNGLRLRQRICYLTGTVDQFAALMKAVTICVLAGVLISGELPMRTNPQSFAVRFIPWLALSLAASILLGRGWLRLSIAGRFESYATSAHLRALFSLVRPDAKFQVTPKDGVDHGGWGWAKSNLEMLAMAAVLAVGLVWGSLVFANVVPGEHLPPFAMLVGVCASVYELQRLLRAAWTISRHRQLRRSYRTQADIEASIGEHGPRVLVCDLSSQGASVTVAPGVAIPEMGRSIPLLVNFGVLGHQRYRFTPSGVFGARIGGRLEPQDDAAQRALDAAVYIIAPHTGRVDATSLSSQTAWTLAARLTPTRAAGNDGATQAA
jgi:cellulose synthase (UDP-forming)